MYVKKKKLKNNTYKIITWYYKGGGGGGGGGVEFYEPFEDFISDISEDEYVEKIEYQQFDKTIVRTDKTGVWRHCACTNEKECYSCDLIRRCPEMFE